MNNNSFVRQAAAIAGRGWSPIPNRRLTIRVWQIVLAAVLLLAITVACQATLANTNPSGDVWSGFLEGKSVDVSTPAGGRVLAVAVQEGDRVQTGQLLVTLDDQTAKLKLAASDAAVAAAQAQLALLQDPPRAEDLAQAEARLAQAEAGLAAASQALSDAQAIRANPQTLKIAQLQAEMSAEAAKNSLDAAARQAEGADLVVKFWQDELDMMKDGMTVFSPFAGLLHFTTPVTRMVDAQEQQTQADSDDTQAWNRAAQANGDYVSAAAALNGVNDQLTDPIALDTRVDEAQGARDAAAAQVDAARGALQALNDGASPAQIQAARDALDRARAQRAALQQDLTHYQVFAPQAGVVESTFYRVGEVVAPSSPLVRLRVEDDLKLMVYVPMTTVAGLHVDQSVNVWVAELNNLTSAGRISRISDQAEYTSRQSQTDSERNALLVGVEITLPNADGRLRAGMPASVSFNGRTPGSVPGLSSVSSSGDTTLSGTLEAKQTRVAAEVAGNVTAVHVAKGDYVHAGDVLVELDEKDIQSDVDAAGAGVRTAQANLDQVNEAARPGAISMAQAALEKANADLAAANRASADAARAADGRQDISAQIEAWKGKAVAAQSGVRQAQTALASKDDQVQQAERDLSMQGKMQSAVVAKQQEAARSTLLAAQATFSGTIGVYTSYQQMFDLPLELIAAKHQAEGQVGAAKAGVAAAQAALDMVTRGPQKDAVSLAQAQVAAAQANLDLIQTQAKHYVVTSPLEGTVLDKSVEVGETAQPGVALMTIADTRELELAVYVPLRSLDLVSVGQAATIRLPSLPGKSYAAKVTTISPESEFKPANIYNSQERSEMVFEVKLTVPNPNQELKGGLPADATFGP